MRFAVVLLLLACAVPLVGGDRLGDSARTVRVLDENGAPVSGAEVAFVEPGEHDLTTNLTADSESAFDGRLRYRTDVDGVAKLPTELAAADIIARAGERFGAARIAFDDLRVVESILQIGPDRTVRVEVRGSDGEPRAGVPVQVEVPRSQWDEFHTGVDLHVGETGADGRLTILHAQTLCTWNMGRPVVRLRAHVAGVDSPFESVDLRKQVHESVSLTCPPFNRILARRWLSEGVRDGVLPAMYGWQLRDELDPIRVRIAGNATNAQGGEWRSYPVALDTTWRLYGARRVVDCVTSTRDQEQVVVDIYELVAKPKHPRRVAGTVVLERDDGTPCANAAVLLGDPSDVHDDDTPRARTDSDGRLRFAAHRPSSSFTLSFFVPGENLVARREVTEAEVANEFVDLGQLRLREPRLAVTGRIVDATTRLPVRAKLNVSGGAWAYAVETTADGTFEIWDDPTTISQPGGMCEIEVDAVCWLYEDSSQLVAVGARGVVIALERPGVMRCRVTADPHVSAGLLELRAMHSTGEEVSLSHARSRAGLLEFAQRIPGNASDPRDWRLVIVGEGGAEILRTAPGDGFERTTDGLAAAIDLTGKLAEFDVFVPQWVQPGSSSDWLAIREHGTTEPWRSDYLLTHRSLLGRAGTRLDAILCLRDHPAGRIVLSPGQATFVPPPRPAFDLVMNAPALPEGTSLQAHILLLQRNEPLRDEAESSGRERVLDDLSGEWPISKERLAQRIRNRSGVALRPGGVRTEVSRLGEYVVLPSLEKRDGSEVLFPEAALVLEAKAPGEVVRGTLRLDAAELEAAAVGK